MDGQLRGRAIIPSLFLEISCHGLLTHRHPPCWSTHGGQSCGQERQRSDFPPYPLRVTKGAYEGIVTLDHSGRQSACRSHHLYAIVPSGGQTCTTLLNSIYPSGEKASGTYPTGFLMDAEYVDYTLLTGKPGRERAIIVKSGSTSACCVVTCTVLPRRAPLGSAT